MCLNLRADWRLQAGLDVDEAQARVLHARLTQRNVLENGEILAIAAPLADGFDRRRPVVGLLPDADVRLEVDVAIDEIVHPPQFGVVAALATGLVEHLQPVLEQAYARRSETGDQFALQSLRIGRGDAEGRKRGEQGQGGGERGQRGSPSGVGRALHGAEKAGHALEG